MLLKTLVLHSIGQFVKFFSFSFNLQLKIQFLQPCSGNQKSTLRKHWYLGDGAEVIVVNFRANEMNLHLPFLRCYVLNFLFAKRSMVKGI